MEQKSMEAKTRRQREHDAAHAAWLEVETKNNRLSNRRADLTAELGELREKRAALVKERDGVMVAAVAGGTDPNDGRIRTEIAALNASIEAKEELLGVIDRELVSHNELHQRTALAREEAARALKREPFELAFDELVACFRRVEANWSIAGQEARLLEQQGDSWAFGKLVALRDRLAPAQTGSHGPYVLDLSRLTDLP